jgi:multiple sugar transport system ATP-binding protein
MRAEIKKLQARLQVTAIYVTHDQVEAMTMGHRIAILHAGKLQQVGTPLEVYERPANLFVATFIGSPPMNMIEATLDAGAGVIQGAGLALPVPGKLRAALAGRGGARVVAGLRPEHVLAPGREPRGESVPLDATIEIAEPLGDEVVVHARVGEAALVFKQDPHRDAVVGQTVQVRIELDALHLFDAATEQRLGA